MYSMFSSNCQTDAAFFLLPDWLLPAPFKPREQCLQRALVDGLTPAMSCSSASSYSIFRQSERESRWDVEETVGDVGLQ